MGKIALLANMLYFFSQYVRKKNGIILWNKRWIKALKRYFFAVCGLLTFTDQKGLAVWVLYLAIYGCLTICSNFSYFLTPLWPSNFPYLLLQQEKIRKFSLGCNQYLNKVALGFRTYRTSFNEGPMIHFLKRLDDWAMSPVCEHKSGKSVCVCSLHQDSETKQCTT